jgi:hypothetical protein
LSKLILLLLLFLQGKQRTEVIVGVVVHFVVRKKIHPCNKGFLVVGSDFGVGKMYGDFGEDCE